METLMLCMVLASGIVACKQDGREMPTRVSIYTESECNNLSAARNEYEERMDEVLRIFDRSATRAKLFQTLGNKRAYKKERKIYSEALTLAERFGNKASQIDEALERGCK